MLSTSIFIDVIFVIRLGAICTGNKNSPKERVLEPYGSSPFTGGQNFQTSTALKKGSRPRVGVINVWTRTGINNGLVTSL